MAIAFVRNDQHPMAAPFYRFAPKEPVAPSGTIQITRIHKLSGATNTAYLLLRAILRRVSRKNTDILIVTHGTSEGLMLPLTKDNTRHLEREPIQAFLDQTIARADKRKILAVTEAQLKALERIVQQVHKLALRRVEFRACHVGANRKTLEALRDFFGAKAAGAPKLQDVYTEMPVPYPGENNRWWTKHTFANVERMAGGKRVGYVLLNVNPAAGSFKFEWAADTVGAQKEWVARHFPLARRVARPPAIHGMLDPMGHHLIFPGDKGYLRRLRGV